MLTPCAAGIGDGKGDLVRTWRSGFFALALTASACGDPQAESSSELEFARRRDASIDARTLHDARGPDADVRDGGADGGTAAIHTAFVILMENKNWQDIKGSSSAPY